MQILHLKKCDMLEYYLVSRKNSEEAVDMNQTLFPV